IGGPVAPVRSSGEEDDVALIPELERGRQGHLLTASALALPADRHRGFPARDQAGGRWHGCTTPAYPLPVPHQPPRHLPGPSPSNDRVSTWGAKPRARACVAAASTISALLPITVFRTRAKIGSPGLGVSGNSPRAPRSSRSTMLLGARSRRPKRSRIWSASPN